MFSSAYYTLVLDSMRFHERGGGGRVFRGTQMCHKKVIMLSRLWKRLFAVGCAERLHQRNRVIALKWNGHDYDDSLHDTIGLSCDVLKFGW